MVKIYCPIYYRVYQRESGRFYSFSGDAFYNPRGIPTDCSSVLEQFGISKEQVLIELFRINGGKEGFYLANIKDEKYYYCGTTWADVRSQLLELGIGREHPQGF
jgi:hypothetical protein